jgi:hypothetical protein
MSMKPEVRERIRAEMIPLVNAWRASHESRRVFASRHGVSLSKFDYWVRQLAPARPRGRHPAAEFAAVEIVSAATAPGVIEVVLAGGDRLVVRAEAGVALVRTVLTALRAKC